MSSQPDSVRPLSGCITAPLGIQFPEPRLMQNKNRSLSGSYFLSHFLSLNGKPHVYHYNTWNAYSLLEQLKHFNFHDWHVDTVPSSEPRLRSTRFKKQIIWSLLNMKCCNYDWRTATSSWLCHVAGEDKEMIILRLIKINSFRLYWIICTTKK